MALTRVAEAATGSLPGQFHLNEQIQLRWRQQIQLLQILALPLIVPSVH